MRASALGRPQVQGFENKSIVGRIREYYLENIFKIFNYNKAFVKLLSHYVLNIEIRIGIIWDEMLALDAK